MKSDGTSQKLRIWKKIAVEIKIVLEMFERLVNRKAS